MFYLIILIEISPKTLKIFSLITDLPGRFLFESLSKIQEDVNNYSFNELQLCETQVNTISQLVLDVANLC